LPERGISNAIMKRGWRDLDEKGDHVAEICKRPTTTMVLARKNMA